MLPEIKRKAITAARLYLEMRGYQIHEQNWGMSRHKIDLITVKNNIINFVEIKYRLDETSNINVEMVTESKLKSIKAATNSWLTETKYSGKYIYSSIELMGPSFSVISFDEYELL